MNKLIQVNIGGLVFQIDEGAYLKLDQYLSAIRRKYEQEEGGKEILNDIELRIAELFSETANAGKAIMMSDVEHVINIMGQPEAFDASEPDTSYASTGRRSSRRFFRDGENRMLGGVCSGFGAYFDIDPLWIRLLFVAVFFFGGTGLLLYIVLWIIMPEAKTTTERLEMRGERVNISNIERTIKTSTQQFTERANAFGKEVSDTFRSENVNKAKNSVGVALEETAGAIKPLFTFIFKIFVFFIVITSLAALVAISIFYFVKGLTPGDEIRYVLSHLFETARDANLALLTGLSLAAIPLAVLLVRGIKYLLNIRVSFKVFDWTMLVLWIACIVVISFIGVQLGNDFSQEGRTSTNLELSAPEAELMVVRLDPFEDDYYSRHAYFGKDWNNPVILNDDTIVFRDIDFSVVRSDDSLFHMTLLRSARGSTRDKAKTRAEKLYYPVQQQDSILLLPSSIRLGEDDLWREQEIDVLLRVPDGKTIVLERELEHFFRYNDYTDRLNDDELFNRRLVMTPSGLKPVY
ncbi:MAG TPA: hypothetical protein DHW15_05205 [Bacteroidetes bacterium]|mgnify:FL=1|jgi:phage shock protein PspC (stress-responsive transcriptional regulator)|nr:MAG: hypothetical protein ABR95_12720 [Sphingobacteriales bacterium BACL12 MAG-120813-bin55]HCK21560.1 hypothetical protein [Bacteroidota bacterium]